GRERQQLGRTGSCAQPSCGGGTAGHRSRNDMSLPTRARCPCTALIASTWSACSSRQPWATASLMRATCSGDNSTGGGLCWRRNSAGGLVAGGDAGVLQLRAEGLLVLGDPGKGLGVAGVRLARALAELGLINEYEFMVQPRLAGHGPT